MRKVARAQLLRDAFSYTSRYRNAASIDNCDAIIMAGHQPTLFHPGVWFKNFLIDELGQRCRKDGLNAVAINLVVDNDVANSVAVRVPVIDWSGSATPSGDRPAVFARYQSVAFDTASGGVPYEQSRVRDRTLFESFDRRIVDDLRPFTSSPLVIPLWQHAKKSLAQCENVSCSLARARHALEGELGLQTLELPLSVICRGEAFAAFAVAIMADINGFREIYNDELRVYRKSHGIRSTAHPVPALGHKDDWQETPFWVYGDDAPQRRALWFRQTGDQWELSDRKEKTKRFDAALGTQQGAEAFKDAMDANWKVRPRALITTMFARSILSDLFVHGIGGAIYDQLGDRIFRRYFDAEPLELMVATATVHLPLDESSAIVTSPSIQSIIRRIRDTHFAPETFEAEANLPPSLVSRKRDLLANVPPRGSKRGWHDEMKVINQQLAGALESTRQKLDSELQRSKSNAASLAVLHNREYSFCLFEEDYLVSQFRQMLNGGD